MDFPLVRGRRSRFTKVDQCGAYVIGSSSTIVTSGFISLAFAPNNRTIDAITVVNANGDTDFEEPGRTQFANYTVTGTFTKVLPELFSMMTGMPLVMDAAGAEAIGISVNSKIDIDLVAFATEVWSKVPAGACEDGDVAYGYALSPFIRGGSLGGITFENGAVSFTLEGAVTADGNQWGRGPTSYLVEKNAATPPVAARLNTAMDPNDHLRLLRTTVAPPAVTDGAVALAA